MFGLSWALFFGALGCIALIKGCTPSAAGALWAVAAGVPALAWRWPELLRRLYVGMAYVAYPLGWVVSLAVLAVVYYLVITPIGLMLRLAGYDPLRRRFDRQAESYWLRRGDPPDIHRYFRQS